MRRGLFRFYPLLWILIPSICGIAGSFFFAIPHLVSTVLALFSLILMVIFHRRLSRFYGDRLSVVSFACSIFLFFFSVSVFRTGTVLTATRPIFLPEDNYRVELLQPFAWDGGWRAVEARVVSSSSSVDIGVRPRVLLILQGSSLRDSLLLAGSILDIRSSFHPILPEIDPFLPDFSHYYRARKIVSRAFVDTSHWRVKEHVGDLSWLNKCRNLQFNLAQSIDGAIDNRDASSLMQAMLLGYKSDLSPQTKAEFRASGLSHILAVSGLHVGIVSLLIGFLLFFIPNSPRLRWIKWLVSIVLVLSYAAITGFSVSVVRASLLFSVLQTGYYLRLQRSAFNSLFLIAILQLASNPLLLFDIGFQLSYVAVGSIVWIGPKMNHYLSDLGRWQRGLLSLLGVTLGVQLALLPLLLYHFHQFPIGFLLANLLVLPLLTWVMCGGFVWLLSVLFGYEWSSFTKIVEWSFDCIGSVAAYVGQWQPLVWNRLWISAYTSLFLMLFFVCIYLYFKRRSSTRFRLLLGSVFLTISSILITHFERKSYQRISVLSVGRGVVLHLVSHTSSAFLTLEGTIDSARLIRRLDGVLSYKSIDSLQIIRRPYLSPTFRYESPILEGCGKTFFIANSSTSTTHFPVKPIEVDYLIVTSSYRGPLHCLSRWCVPTTVIATSYLPSRIKQSLLLDSFFSDIRLLQLDRGGFIIESI